MFDESGGENEGKRCKTHHVRDREYIGDALSEASAERDNHKDKTK